jgi:UDP-N-acetyl-D-galactosamine dehydrogenase
MKLVVVGLGYVGLPLAVALARHFEVWGIDIDASRIAELRDGHDRTDEIDAATLTASTLNLTSDPAACPAADAYIVTVPTPIDDAKRPDLGAVMSATRMVAAMIDPALRPTVIYESTVYPGVTENLCGPEIEKISGLKRGADFTLGYSPERINPGDREHTVDRIIKVIAGEDEPTTDRLEAIYGRVTSAGVFRAASIKAAEAAKAIENAQRDINIAFMNEITRIFAGMDLSIWDVLAAARTKWNFLPFQPGLVGGHCIGVDPYYLSHLAEELGHDPRVILAGRDTNDGMAHWLGDELHQQAGGKPGSALVLGLTFKENVPDLRNSKVVDLVDRLRALGHDVAVHDPLADLADAERHATVIDPDALSRTYDMVVLAVPHADYLDRGLEFITELVAPGGFVADVKNALPATAGYRRWTL